MNISSKLKVQSSKLDNSSKKATSMADLMKSAKTSFVRLKKGENLKGIITKLTPSEILIDINAKTEAVVLEKDKRNMRNILSLCKVGDTVLVSVINPESDLGFPVVSLRRFIDDLLWEKLLAKKETHEKIPVVVSESTKGGFLVDAEIGLSGFLPNSQTLPLAGDQSLIGRKIDAYILEVNRPNHKIIFSQKPSLQTEEFVKLVKNIKIDQKMSATITSLTPFGVFVSISVSDTESVDGLIHISEIAWEKTVDPSVVGAVGETIEGVVIKIDKEAKRIDLSLKRLSSDPFEEIAKKFSLEQKVSGTVTEKQSAGIVVSLDDNVEGFIRKEKIPPDVVYEIGEKTEATVSEVDKKRRRIILVPVLLRKTIGYR